MSAERQALAARLREIETLAKAIRYPESGEPWLTYEDFRGANGYVEDVARYFAALSPELVLSLIAALTDDTARRLLGEPATVTRVEVIDHRLLAPEPGRVFVAGPECRTELSYQDGGRTLKVFVSDALDGAA